MSVAQWVIVVVWLLLPPAAAVFLLLLGPPGRYRDRTMAWHLSLTAVVAGAEPIGFLVAGFSLWPAALVHVGALAVMCWRIGLLILARRAARRARTKT